MLRLAFFLLLTAAAGSAAAGTDLSEIVRLRAAADSLHGAGRTDSALVVGRRALELARRSGNRIQIVGTNAAQGVFLRSAGKVEEALECYREALGIVTSETFRKNPGEEAIEEAASLYINLAVLHLDMAHRTEAARYARKAGEWIARSDEAELKSRICGVAGSVLTGTGALDEALKFQDMSYGFALAAGNKEDAFRAAAYTMLIADRLGRKAEAGRWREKCLALFSEVPSMMARLIYFQAECAITLTAGDREKALSFFRKILDMDGIEALPFVRYDCYNNMHLAYAGLGRYEEAYGALMAGNAIRDSLYEQEKAESLRELTVKYETKETELALAQSEASRAQTFVWLLASVAVLLVTAVVFVLYASRQHQARLRREMDFARLRADIGRRLTQQFVEGLENERQRMAGELHDGVCNDLLAIQMNMRNGVSPATTEKLIDTCRESVRRISHELMPPEFAYATIDEVVRYFVGKQAEAYPHVEITCDTTAAERSWESVPDKVALEVYRIVQEAVGNALKHSGADTIAVNMELDGKSMRFTVADNGTAVSGGRRGMGIDSMKRRAKAIDAAFCVSSAAGHGTKIDVSVRI